MRGRLFILGSFTDDPQGVLTDIGQFALMGIECSLNVLLRVGFELYVAAFAYANLCSGPFYDPQFAFWHADSLAQWHARRNAL